MRHPADLVAWRRWHESRHPVRSTARSVRAHLRPSAEARVALLTPDHEIEILVAVEATHASVDRAVVAPLAHLSPARTAIVAPLGWEPPTAYATHQRHAVTLASLTERVSPRVILAAGHYTEIGAAAFALAEDRNLHFFVSQHGALTPFAPPLPRGAHLLAWSDADGEFWTSGRKDVTVTATGSQLLWGVGGLESARPTKDADRLIYLGQGHAAEIPRGRLVEAALLLCREHGAIYRPHPSERDRLSLMTLNAYQRAGITLDAGDVPLADLTNPVVSVFSTGILEAAARGRHAWVDFPRPPAWLGEFWERYGMHRLGSTPTPAPERPMHEPARRMAEIVSDAAS